MLGIQLTTLTDRAPSNAAQRLSTSKPGTNQAVSSRQIALRMNINSPSVTRVKGNVSTRRIGRTIALIRPSVRPAPSNVRVLSTRIPEIIRDATRIAEALMMILSSIEIRIIINQN